MKKPVDMRHEIPADHMPTVLNSLICEHLLHFERRVNKAGEFQWRGTKTTGEVTPWSAELVDFAGDLKEAQDLLHNYCKHVGMGYNLIFNPQNDKHVCVLLAVGEDGKPVPRVQIIGNPLSQLICAALCGLNGFQLEQQHRTLFPAHYLLLNS